ncbi:MAG TPA: hypothetical protein ENN32_08155 [Chloroflexi bacterium]|nr:hypothetical protein [Chloroflexota bacterium]
MRQVTYNDSISDLEIHPPGTYQPFRELARESAFVLDRSQFVELTECPACGSQEITPAFDKWRFHYAECQQCSSLFVSNRPNLSQLSWYLNESPAALYRQSSSYMQTMQTNYERLSAYRASWIDSIAIRIPKRKTISILDLETRSANFLTLLSQQAEWEVSSVAPRFAAESDEQSRAYDFLDDVNDESVSILTAFDILEHQYSPRKFFETIRKKLQSGGFLLMTTRVGSGFDIQILGEYCPTIVPIEHLNLLSVEGIKLLLREHNLSIFEISTPGQLDVETVAATYQQTPELVLPKSVRYFFDNRDDLAKQNLQQFLQANLLSSHLRLVAQKKD